MIGVLGAIAAALALMTSTAGAANRHAPPRRARAVPPAAAQRPHVVLPGTGTIPWGPCKDAILKRLGAQCGTVSVPIDYADPTGPHISLAVSVLAHSSAAADYQGVVLTNPGGPGASGLDLSAELAATLTHERYDAAAADYDWIGFDPRGTGSSEPVRCQRNFQGPDRRDYTPRTKSLLHYWLSRSDAYARACVSHGAQQTAILDNDTTIDSARDMDAIRAALGVPEITYYGFSYGTYLGQVYATLFPANVRRLILDSNVDPRGVWYGSNLAQDPAFERNVNIWFAWLAKHHRFYRLGATRAAVSRRFYAVKAALAAKPIRGQVGPDEWTDIFLQAGYYEQTWLGLGALFAGWVHHPGVRTGNALVAAYRATDSPSDDNSLAAYLAVQCSDAPWPHSIGTVLADNTRVNRSAPFITWANAWFNGPCSYWRPPSSTPVQINGGGIANALLIDETLDAATPFEGSLEVRRLFPRSVLLAEPGGTTHADSLSGDRCVDGTIAAYLAVGTLPARRPNAEWDKTCHPLPVPEPRLAKPGVAPALAPDGGLPGRREPSRAAVTG
ncbi:MAG: alpha/beta fold hydrolase [Solirubrobacterales bacterium]|nr:alpha/beta fold hydrolase [Solirubrobacterales bacterium]